jgi:hypothetical protein
MSDRPKILGAAGGAAPPPSFLMHQLGGLDITKFPFLDSKIFPAQVNTQLTGLNQTSTTQ